MSQNEADPREIERETQRGIWIGTTTEDNAAHIQAAQAVEQKDAGGGLVQIEVESGLNESPNCLTNTSRCWGSLNFAETIWYGTLGFSFLYPAV